MRDLAALPKAHLHLHLEAAMSPATLQTLSAKYNREVPTTRGYGSFAAFSDLYVASTDVLREPADWEFFADQVFADHQREGAVRVECAFWAGNYRHLRPDEGTWEIVFAACRSAAKRYGISLGFIVAVDRVKDTPESAMVLAKFAAQAGDDVVGLGLHNDEVGHPPAPFADAFAYARAAGLAAVPHAGELESGQFVADSIDQLGAIRIGHGVRSPEVDGLLDRLVNEGIHLEVCPTSNLMLGVVPSYAEHPLPSLFAYGVRCSVNGDDPLLFGSTLLGEYEVCRREFGFTDSQLAQIARYSIEDSLASPQEKQQWLKRLTNWEDRPA